MTVQHPYTRRFITPEGCAIETTQDKPGLLNAYAVMTLIDGIFNLCLGVLAVGVLFCGTIICAPLGAYPVVLGILELVHFGPLNRTPPGRRDVPVWLAVMQLIGSLFSNPLALATGIIGLVAGNDAKVRAYLAGGGQVNVLSLTCRQCGFDLRGSVAAGQNTCPECGADAPHITAARASMHG